MTYIMSYLKLNIFYRHDFSSWNDGYSICCIEVLQISFRTKLPHSLKKSFYVNTGIKINLTSYFFMYIDIKIGLYVQPDQFKDINLVHGRVKKKLRARDTLSVVHRIHFF